MARLLKRWESPRREGRNDKGRGGSARARQLKKQQKMLRKKLKEASKGEENQNARGGKINSLLYFFGMDCLRSRSRRFIYFLINRVSEAIREARIRHEEREGIRKKKKKQIDRLLPISH